MGVIIVDTDEFEKMLDKLPAFPKKVNAAMSRTLNSAASRVVTNVLKDVSNEYAIKKPQVRKTVDKKKAKPLNLQAEVIIKGKQQKMGNFKFKVANNKQRSPVTVTIKKSNGAVTSKSKPALFGARGGIYHRTPEDPTYKIGWAFTLSVPQMVSSDEVYNKIAEDAHEYILKQFPKNLKYTLEDMVKKGRY